MCRVCNDDVYFISYNALAAHLTEAHGRNIETMCKMCHLQLPSKADLETHRCSFATNSCDILVCFVCYEEFSHISGLKTHVETQHQLACFTCMKVLRSRRAYRKHTRTFHEPNVLKHKCNICEKYFTKMSKLKLHLRVAHKRRVKVASKCPYCRKPCPKDYKKHVATHEKSGVRK